MSLFQRAQRDVVRSYTQGPLTLKDPALARLFSDGVRASSGAVVNEVTAMNYSGVWAAVNMISGHVGSLPLILYKRLPNGGKERFTTHPLYRLIHDAPNPESTAMVWRDVLQSHVLTWGNCYAEIERDGIGRPFALWPITPDRVTPKRDEHGAIVYVVTSLGRAPVTIPARDMLHVPGLGFDGLMGYSVIAKAREAIGLGLSAEKFGATFYGNGATFGGVLTSTMSLDEEQRNAVRANIEGFHQGAERAHRFLVLSNGFKYEKMGIPPHDAQFVESRRLQIEEIARWFNLPPHKLKDLSRATFSNIEHLALEYVSDSLLPWLVRWEQEINRKLLTKAEQASIFCEFLVDGLLRGDSAARAEFYSKLFQLGAMSLNEIRARENLNPIPGGDEHFVSMNLQPLSRAIAAPAAENDTLTRAAEIGARLALRARTADPVWREPSQEYPQ